MTAENEAAQSAAEEKEPAAAAPQAEQEDRTAIWAELKAEEEGKAPKEAAADQPAEEPQPEPEPEKPADAPQQVQDEDIWANATPAQRAAYEAATAEKAKFEQRFRSSVGRISALQKKINAAQREPESRAPASARDAIAGIKDDYPEIAKPIEDALGAIEGRIERFSQAEKSAREADEAELNALVEAETNRLLAKHADYADVLSKNGSAFQQWVADQPLRIREAAHRNASFIADADGAIEVINGFKQHLGLTKPAQQPPPSDRRQRQIDASAAPHHVSGRPTVSGPPPEGADRQTHWNYWKTQDNDAR